MERLRIVSIGGFGHSGSVFDEIAQMDPSEAELTALAPAYEGEDVAKFAKHKAFGGRARRFDDYRAMLAAVRPHVAIVGTRLDRIAPVAIAAANAGCNVICDKPLALDRASLERLHAAVKKSGARLIAMLSMRRHAAFVAARKLYREGVIGEVALANARKSYKWGASRPDWFGRRETYGGTIGWIGIHALDMINYITGVEFASVAAMQSNFGHKEWAACEDNCALALELSNGGHAAASIDYWRPSTAPTHGDDWARIVGTKGVIEANASRETCHVISEGREPYDAPLEAPVHFYKAFLRSLLGLQEFDTMSPSDPFMLTDACLRARDAADARAVVEIEQGRWR